MEYEDISRYQCRLDELLSAVNIPAALLSCNGECYDPCEHRNLVNLYYDKIISCIATASENVIPRSKIYGNEHNVTGWTDCLWKTRHSSASFSGLVP